MTFLIIIVTFVIKTISDQAVQDRDAVALQYLDRHYGLPAGSLNPKTNLTPTIPYFFVKSCDRGDKFALTLPADLQSKIAACVTVIKQSKQQIYSGRWIRGFNSPGIKFGDKKFFTLPTYKT